MLSPELLLGPELLLAAHALAHVNALLNATATVLLLAGYAMIRQRRELAHKRLMLAAFAVSVAFLGSYLTYHWLVGSVAFTGQGAIRIVYYTILVTHVVLAAIVPFLAAVTIYFGLRDRRKKHRQVARWTFPIWLYVSVTGVIVYLMLYHLFPAET